MIDYRSPVDSIFFALTHVAGAARLPRWDEDTARQVLAEAGRFIDAEIAPLDPIGDITDARLVDGRVVLPERYVSAYRRLSEGGWQGLTMAEEYGGQQLPHVLSSAVTEMLAGACVTFQMIVGLAQAAARAIATVGTPEQQARCIPPLAATAQRTTPGGCHRQVMYIHMSRSDEAFHAPNSRQTPSCQPAIRRQVATIVRS